MAAHSLGLPGWNEATKLHLQLPRALLRLIAVGVPVFAGIALLAELEKRGVRPDPFAYENPVFDTYHAARTLAMLIAGLALTWAIAPTNADAAPLRASRLPLICANLLAALAAAALAGLDIGSFNLLAREDGPVETATALLLFLASACFAVTVVRLVRAPRRDALYLFLCLALSLGFFVLAMEEISWMQRIIGFKTPDELAQMNWQHEVNFHNTHTFAVDCIYYTLSAFALVFLPVLGPSLKGWPLFERLAEFVPGHEVALITAPAFLFNFGHWDVLPVQLAFWMTAGMASLITLQQRRSTASIVGLYLLLGLFIGQAFVMFGGTQTGIMPDSTEYQELIIALGYASFAIGTGGRLVARSARDAVAGASDRRRSQP